MAAYFEVPPSGLKFKFDGETLKDSDTFRSAGIEEDDMIDAEVIDIPSRMPHTYIHTYIHTVHTFIHTYIHTHIHTTYTYTVDQMRCIQNNLLVNELQCPCVGGQGSVPPGREESR